MKYKVFGALVIAIVLLILIKPVENTASGTEVNNTQIVCDKNDDAMYYSSLDDTEKRVYDKILQDLLSFNRITEVYSYNADNFKVLYKCVLADHPEIFYMKHGEMTIAHNGDGTDNIKASWEYYVTQEYANAVNEKMNEHVDELKRRIDGITDDYEKLRISCEIIMHLAEYDINGFNTQNIDSVFMWGKTVCGGYARAFKYLANSIGIDCKFVVGYADDVYHAWNKVYVNGEEFCIDVTWCDAKGNLDLFMVPIEEFSKTHVENENYILIEDALAEYNEDLYIIK